MNILDLYQSFDMWVEHLMKNSNADRPTAEDICQDVFLFLHNKYGDADLDIHEPTGFMHTALRAKYCEYIKKMVTRRRRDTLYMQDFLAHARATRSYDKELALLFSLVPQYKDLLTQFYIKCHSLETLARKEHTTIASVKCRLQRARACAKKIFMSLVPLITLLKEKHEQER